MLEHDGCRDCKHEHREEYEYPCCGCRGTLTSVQQAIFHRLDHWEPKDGTADNVNHPSHYQGKHECIDEMIALFGVEAVKHFCMCNVYKYRFRAANKNGQEDLDKADWYMDKLLELEGEPK